MRPYADMGMELDGWSTVEQMLGILLMKKIILTSVAALAFSLNAAHARVVRNCLDPPFGASQYGYEQFIETTSKFLDNPSLALQKVCTGQDMPGA